MNLFVLDTDPAKAAAGLDDKRIGSALRECNQMMSTAVIRHATDSVRGTMELGTGLLCQPTHQQHPVTLWVGATIGNFTWCYQHTRALIKEWQLRYGTTHASGDRTPYIWKFNGCIPDGPLLTFQNSARHEGMGLDFSHLLVPHSYRMYLMERWKTDKRAPSYTNREWPEWAKSHLPA